MIVYNLQKAEVQMPRYMVNSPISLGTLNYVASRLQLEPEPTSTCFCRIPPIWVSSVRTLPR